MAHITPSTLNDVSELNILINKAYRGESSKKGWTTEANLLDGLRIDEATLVEYINDADTAILKYTNNNGGIEGCVYLNRGTDKLYIGMLSVNPELQNTGIGRQLLEAATEHAKQLNCDTLWMTVISTRSELIAYYERKGFELTGEKKPFPTDTKFGIQKQPLELIVLQKLII
jgi:ribosomal protein S18 acetylase RimI-like enzyme